MCKRIFSSSLIGTRDEESEEETTKGNKGGELVTVQVPPPPPVHLADCLDVIPATDVFLVCIQLVLALLLRLLADITVLNMVLLFTFLTPCSYWTTAKDALTPL